MSHNRRTAKLNSLWTIGYEVEKSGELGGAKLQSKAETQKTCNIAPRTFRRTQP